MRVTENTLENVNYSLSSISVRTTPRRVLGRENDYEATRASSREHPNIEQVMNLADNNGRWTLEGTDEVHEASEIIFLHGNGKPAHRMPYERFVKLGKPDSITVSQIVETTYETPPKYPEGARYDL